MVLNIQHCMIPNIPLLSLCNYIIIEIALLALTVGFLKMMHCSRAYEQN